MFLNNFPGVWRKVSADFFCNSQAQTDHGRRGHGRPTRYDRWIRYTRSVRRDGLKSQWSANTSFGEPPGDAPTTPCPLPNRPGCVKVQVGVRCLCWGAVADMRRICSAQSIYQSMSVRRDVSGAVPQSKNGGRGQLKRRLASRRCRVLCAVRLYCPIRSVR